MAASVSLEDGNRQLRFSLRGTTMAKSTRQHVFEGMELLPEGLIPFVEKRLENSLKGHWKAQVLEKLSGLKTNGKGELNWDQSALLNAMDRFWMDAFKEVLGRAEGPLSTSRRCTKQARPQ